MSEPTKDLVQTRPAKASIFQKPAPGTGDRWPWIFAACVVLAVVVICNLPLLTGRVAPVWDAVDYYRPFFSLVADYTRTGRLLLWDPWINAGSPDFAEPSIGAASPVFLLFGLLFGSGNLGFAAYWIAFWAFGGVGMLLLCRHLGAPSWGALIVALGFVSCGFYTGHGEHTATIYSFSFIPWIIWRFDSALTTRRYFPAAEAGLLWGLSGLGGYPQIVILDVMFLGPWAIGRLWLARKDPEPDLSLRRWRECRFAVVALIVIVIVGTAVLSPSYFSFFRELRGYTDRVEFLGRARALHENLLPPAALNSFASPFLYLLNLPPYRVWPETDVSMSNIYVGVLILVIVAAALTKYSGWKLWLASVAAFFLACSVGWHLPIRGWLYDLVPPTRFFRNPSYFRAYVIVTLCILAALGTRELDTAAAAEQSRNRLRWWLAAVLAAAVACYSFTRLFYDVGFFGCAPPPDVFGAHRAALAFLATWFGVLLVFFLWWKQRLSKVAFVIALILLAVGDAATTLRISEFTTYTPNTVPWLEVMNSHHVKDLDLTAREITRNLHPPESLATYPNDRNLAIKDAELANYGPLQNKLFNAYLTDPVLYQIAIGQSRMWFSARPTWLPPSTESFAVFSTVSHALGVPPLFLHKREEMEQGGGGTPSSSVAVSEEAGRLATSVVPAAIELTRYGPNTLSLRYSAPTDGWLLVTDRWASGWAATVNGTPSEVLGADFIFRAVRVTRGENLVSFRYRPTGYLGFVALSWGTMLAVAVCTAVRIRRRFRERDGGASALGTGSTLAGTILFLTNSRWRPILSSSDTIIDLP
jgi:hypothetical protein